MICYVYRKTESGVFTVGFYAPGGEWEAESDHSSREEAAGRVHYLNCDEGLPAGIQDALNSGDGVYRP